MTASLVIRAAMLADLPQIIALHAADDVGGHGDTTDPAALPAYETAFKALTASDEHGVYVAVEDDTVIGTFVITWKPGLTGRGETRAELRSVQVRQDRRSSGIGAKMVAFAEVEAKRGGATAMELTSNNKRPAAHRFYERLGFTQSHQGFKKKL